MGEVPTGPWVLLVMGTVLVLCLAIAGISAIVRFFSRLKREVKNLEAQGNGESKR